MTTKTTRQLNTIANEIFQDWEEKVYFGARPYLEAMTTLSDINQDFGCDSGKSIVRYFLANATTWRGETARRIKKELNSMLK
jgi:hypothetical protein